MILHWKKKSDVGLPWEIVGLHGPTSAYCVHGVTVWVCKKKVIYCLWENPAGILIESHEETPLRQYNVGVPIEQIAIDVLGPLPSDDEEDYTKEDYQQEV